MNATQELAELIREVSAEGPYADPADIAPLVSARVSAQDRAVLFEVLLPEFVRHVVTFRPGGHQDPQETIDRADPSGSPSPGSSRADMHRAHNEWSALNQGVRTVDGWKLFGDCGDLDLKFAEEHRREKAEAVVAVADRFRATRELLARHGVQLVRELPAAELRAVWNTR